MLYLKKTFLAFVLAVGDLVAIGASGWYASFSLAKVNEYLQFFVLILTIAGLIWRMFKRKKI